VISIVGRKITFSYLIAGCIGGLSLVLMACTQNPLETYYKDALSGDPDAAMSAVKKLGEHPGPRTIDILLTVAQLPKPKEFDPVRIAAIEILSSIEDEDQSGSLAIMLLREAPTKIQLAVARSLEESKCNKDCIMYSFTYLSRLWVNEQLRKLGRLESISREESELEGATRDSLLKVLRREKEMTVQVAKESWLGTDNPAVGVVPVTAQLNLKELCPLLLESFVKVPYEDKRSEIQAVLEKLNCEI
jgi:HEAT repeat protein